MSLPHINVSLSLSVSSSHPLSKIKWGKYPQVGINKTKTKNSASELLGEMVRGVTPTSTP